MIDPQDYAERPKENETFPEGIFDGDEGNADDSLTNPNTTEVKGGRKQSSGRLGDKRYFMTRILTSMNKLARNPLLNRPLQLSTIETIEMHSQRLQ